MRVLSTVEQVEVRPGSAGVIPLQLVNTSDVIDSMSVHAFGMPGASVRASPEHLTLFPDADGEVVVTLTVPPTFPAGTYRLTLVARGRSPLAVEAHHDVDVTVPPLPALAMGAEPSLVRARGRALFTVRVVNEGNTPLDLALRAVDSDRTVQTSLTPSTLRVPVGGSATSRVITRGPRQLLGSDRDRPLRVVAQGGDVEGDVALTLRQRSTFSRGLVTALILVAIVGAWALAFGLGMTQVLGGDPFTKVAPASFFAGAADAAGAAGGAPAGALAKEGPLPAGVGGTISGTVRGAEDGAGVGRLTLDALRRTRDGLVVVSSAATQADGTYTLAGLFPGSYLVRLSAEGYDALWHPSGAGEAGAATVRAAAQAVTEGVDFAVVGHPASISGLVDTGQAPGAVEVTVTARPAWEGADPLLTYPTFADASGAYAFTGLPAPGTYELTFEAEGYQPSTLTERVLGGQERLALSTALSAGTGQISGLVTDGARGLGGVAVTTTVAGKEVVVGTPTLGQVGAFVVPGLPTPATYVLTFSKDGFTTRTVVVDLGPGETRTDVTAALAGGAGTVTGTVVDESGTGIGGVTVTAGGTAGAGSTTTLTAGAVGTFTLAGLRGAESLTLTFTKPGYTSVSIPVTLGDGAAAPVRATLSSALGSVRGLVTQGGTGLVGVVVEATDGTTVRSTTTTATGGSGPGSYVLADLPAGTYTVTVLRGGAVVTSALVTVRRGAASALDLPVPAVG